jgi:hypothetical protein
MLYQAIPDALQTCHRALCIVFEIVRGTACSEILKHCGTPLQLEVLVNRCYSAADGGLGPAFAGVYQIQRSRPVNRDHYAAPLFWP